uniref:Uncharacterized protein n=1 Tax=Meloidogyne incognita TaxID=6306 RepID=A0A914NK27_MELIC
MSTVFIDHMIWNVPSNYETYRASNRGQIGFAPLSNYQSYVDTLQRSLSRERYERDRVKFAL